MTRPAPGSIMQGPAAMPWILMVDDEEDILPEYQEFFELTGYKTLVTSDPDQAFTMVLGEARICLVITDLRMAGRDGASLIRDLRTSLPAGRQVEFIILTGDASSRLGQDLADIPVFLKPADTEALLASIRVILASTAWH